MKTTTLISLLLALFVFPLFGQQKMTPEQMAIKKVIEDETMYFNQRNFDKWAECVAHDEMAYFTYTSPFHGENALWEARGWDEISKSVKETMSKWPVDENLPEKTDYKFKVAGDMAYVTFTENEDLSETRVLEKKDGKWRILRMEATNREAFKKFHQLYAMHRMAGTWEVDVASMKYEGDGDWKLIDAKIEIEGTPTGITRTQQSTYRTGDGDVRISEEKGMMSLHMGSGKIGLFNTNHYPYSGWTQTYMGEGEYDEDGVLHWTGHPVGRDGEFKGKMWWDGDGLSYSGVAKNEKGEQIMSVSYQLKRKGVDQSKP